MIFVQSIDPYRQDMLVVVGETLAKTKEWVNKHCSQEEKRKEFCELLDIRKECFDNIESGENIGMTFQGKKGNNKYLVLLLNKPQDVWDYWECLLHELSHILDWVCQWKMLETEARAYLHEWLFREIRRKIMGYEKI